jgi:hypothetical protein
MVFRARSASVFLVLVAALVAGCGAAGQAVTDGPSTSPQLTGGAPLTLRAPVSVARRALPPVGATQRVDSRGASLEVTLRKVIDPLRDSGAKLQHGTRAVGVFMQIRSSGPAIYDSSATGDISIVASAGAVSPVFATHGVCRTPLNDFDRYITAGEDRVGCVVFAVSDAATLDAVRFMPHARARGLLSWAP